MSVIECDVNATAFVRNVVKTASYIGVDSVLFRPKLVSGIGGTTGLSVVLLHPHDHNLPFDALGITSPVELKNRLSLIASDVKAITVDTVQGKLDDNPDAVSIVSKMHLKSGRMKITHGAGNPKVIKAPRRIAFNAAYTMSVDVEAAATTMGNATKALSTDGDTTVALTALKGELSIRVVDKNNDAYEDVLTDRLGDGVSFSHKYVLKFFNLLIRAHNATDPIEVSGDGILKFNIYGLTVYQLPHKG